MAIRSGGYSAAPEAIGLSRFESSWALAAPGRALIPGRTIEYDPVALMFYSPTEYTEASFRRLDGAAIDEQWLRSALETSVLGGDTPDRQDMRCPPAPEFAGSEHTSDEFIIDILERCEAEYVYAGLFGSVVYEKGDTTADKLRKMYTILCHPVIGNVRNSKLFSFEKFAARTARLLEERRPLQFALPAFPFKDQNPLRTISPPDHVDLGEIGLLIRLHVLALALFQVHPFGVEWVILSDGSAYAPVFGVELDAARRYAASLRAYRNRLNLQETIHIIDLGEMTGRFEGFPEVRSTIRSKLGDLYSRHDALVRDRIKILARGMRRNINMRSLLRVHGWEALWEAVHGTEADEEGPAGRREPEQELRERSINTALDYAAFNLAMRRVDMIASFLPLAVRATVHPKRDQIAIPHHRRDDQRLLPWNCVPAFDDQEMNVDSVRLTEVWTLAEKESWRKVCLYGSGEPFYFRGRLE